MRAHMANLACRVCRERMELQDGREILELLDRKAIWDHKEFKDQSDFRVIEVPKVTMGNVELKEIEVIKVNEDMTAKKVTWGLLGSVERLDLKALRESKDRKGQKDSKDLAESLAQWD